MQLTRMYTKIVRSHSSVCMCAKNDEWAQKLSKGKKIRRKKVRKRKKEKTWNENCNNNKMKEEKKERNWGFCPIVFFTVVVFAVGTRFSRVGLHLTSLCFSYNTIQIRCLLACQLLLYAVYVISFQFLCIAHFTFTYNTTEMQHNTAALSRIRKFILPEKKCTYIHNSQ